ncbi:nitrite reductase small subunit NirD [Aeromonas schubertii]|nr:nitrite reductase small subunit NirD [Aeromonas schubertii]KUE81221.1 nitrite reductase small subunit [Aeromonas schubertii]MBZ6068181.1 nitrite reductase small subunit NirD [Aeromonas schubertii]MBZ6073473.1 nitrite reductase small subunit NirD [Aeromonas schubertii]QCG49696.1 nitrite reductase small subunit NirD [Aeromonas schubertii]
MQLACLLDDILPGTGVCALIAGHQVALFRPTDGESLFAIGNQDPFYQANVLSRGLIGEHEGEFWVASPLKKQRFRLRDGLCLDNPAVSVPAYRLELRGREVWVAV